MPVRVGEQVDRVAAVLRPAAVSSRTRARGTRSRCRPLRRAIEIVRGAKRVEVRRIDLRCGFRNLDLKACDSDCFAKLVWVTPRVGLSAIT